MGSHKLVGDPFFDVSNTLRKNLKNIRNEIRKKNFKSTPFKKIRGFDAYDWKKNEDILANHWSSFFNVCLSLFKQSLEVMNNTNVTKSGYQRKKKVKKK